MLDFDPGARSWKASDTISFRYTVSPAEAPFKAFLQRPRKEFVCKGKRNSQQSINRKGGRDEDKIIPAISGNTGNTVLSWQFPSRGCNAPPPCSFPWIHAFCRAGQLVFMPMRRKGRDLTSSHTWDPGRGRLTARAACRLYCTFSPNLVTDQRRQFSPDERVSQEKSREAEPAGHSTPRTCASQK